MSAFLYPGPLRYRHIKGCPKSLRLSTHLQCGSCSCQWKWTPLSTHLLFLPRSSEWTREPPWVSISHRLFAWPSSLLISYLSSKILISFRQPLYLCMYCPPRAPIGSLVIEQTCSCLETAIIINQEPLKTWGGNPLDTVGSLLCW